MEEEGLLPVTVHGTSLSWNCCINAQAYVPTHSPSTPPPHLHSHPHSIPPQAHKRHTIRCSRNNTIIFCPFLLPSQSCSINSSVAPGRPKRPVLQQQIAPKQSQHFTTQNFSLSRIHTHTQTHTSYTLPPLPPPTHIFSNHSVGCTQQT